MGYETLLWGLKFNALTIRSTTLLKPAKKKIYNCTPIRELNILEIPEVRSKRKHLAQPEIVEILRIRMHMNKASSFLNYAYALSGHYKKQQGRNFFHGSFYIS